MNAYRLIKHDPILTVAMTAHLAMACSCFIRATNNYITSSSTLLAKSDLWSQLL